MKLTHAFIFIFAIFLFAFRARADAALDINSEGRYPSSQASERLAVDKVSLNQSSLEQLELLPGIDPVKAEAIIKARPFYHTEEVMKVKGIKERTFSKIKDKIIL